MEKSYVTMEQKLCPICGKNHDTGSILLDRRLKERFDMHTTTGYDLCKECSSLNGEYLALVVCDSKKSGISPEETTLKMENAYRTGEIIRIRRTMANQIFKSDLSKMNMVFIDEEVAQKLKELKAKEE